MSSGLLARTLASRRPVVPAVFRRRAYTSTVSVVEQNEKIQGSVSSPSNGQVPKTPPPPPPSQVVLPDPSPPSTQKKPNRRPGKGAKLTSSAPAKPEDLKIQKLQSEVGKKAKTPWKKAATPPPVLPGSTPLAPHSWVVPPIGKQKPSPQAYSSKPFAQRSPVVQPKNQKSHFLRSQKPKEHLHLYTADVFPPASSVLTTPTYRQSLAGFQELYGNNRWRERTVDEDGESRTYLTRDVLKDEFTEGILLREQFERLGKWEEVVMGPLFIRWASAIQDLHRHHAEIKVNRDIVRIRTISHTTYYPPVPFGSIPDPARPETPPQGLTTRDLHLAASLEKLVGHIKQMLAEEASLL